MKKYTNENKTQKKKSMFATMQYLKKKKTYYEVKESMGYLTEGEEIDKNKTLNRLQNVKKMLKRRVIALTLATTVIGSVSINKGINNDLKRDSERIESAYTQIDDNFNMENSENSNTEYKVVNKEDEKRYDDYKKSISEYMDLSNKKESNELVGQDKQRFDQLKKEITTQYDLMDELALEIAKTKIAKVLNIKDINSIKLVDETTQIKADRNNQFNGTNINMYVSAEGKVIAQEKAFKSLTSGEVYKERDDLPKEIKKLILNIGRAQLNTKERKSEKALESALKLSDEDLQVLKENYTKEDKDIER